MKPYDPKSRHFLVTEVCAFLISAVFLVLGNYLLLESDQQIWKVFAIILVLWGLGGFAWGISGK